MQPNQHAQAVARRVREISRANRTPQAALAEALGITQQNISQRLLGRVEFTISELHTISATLGCTLAELLEDQPESQIPA
ncbi:XRE family transcriptional regulator [Rhodococcus sp. 15-2388-1-1a]|uniref:helix-turn-helix domain-containing protein n=1 Tax=Nocardiaceae TaxID=85025 RepID=UPI00056AEDC1|nr:MULTISPECIES: helix-turn-helix transcriptional regulator [Rhodococcus]OZF05217.1 XRE family transcriptional regulator [Rhodococcus sp. 15-2388-1-1a]